MNAQSSVEKSLKTSSLCGILLGMCPVLACELPIILALIGLGSLSATASALKPPDWVEIAALTALGVGALMLLITGVRRRRMRVQVSAE